MKSLKQHIAEGRPSQRHPLEGHDYHKKTDAELTYIAKDAHKAAEAMKSHNTQAENKYRDQANDSATVRYWRQKNGMPDWYKKKYGHMKEEVEQIEELSKDTLLSYANKVSLDSQKHSKDPTKRSAQKASRSVIGYARAHNKLEKSVKEEIEQIDEVKLVGIMRHPEHGKAYIWHKGGEGGYNYEVEHTKTGKKKTHQKSHADIVADMKKQGYKMHEEVEQVDEVAAWQRKEGKSESGGLNRKGIESYRRENPGSKLSMAVTTKPSKLKPGSKAANRRKSFCARMGGMKKRLTSAKTARDPDSRINKALRKWNC